MNRIDRPPRPLRRLPHLAAGARVSGAGLYDPHTAIMLRGISWLFDGGAEGAPPGLQPFPAELPREIARLAVEL